jgi:hypothetical protein
MGEHVMHTIVVMFSSESRVSSAKVMRKTCDFKYDSEQSGINCAIRVREQSEQSAPRTPPGYSSWPPQKNTSVVSCRLCGEHNNEPNKSNYESKGHTRVVFIILIHVRTSCTMSCTQNMSFCKLYLV